MICDVCGQPIDGEEPCRPHEPDCIERDFCRCDVAVHPGCCPDCVQVPGATG